MRFAHQEPVCVSSSVKRAISVAWNTCYLQIPICCLVLTDLTLQNWNGTWEFSSWVLTKWNRKHEAFCGYFIQFQIFGFLIYFVIAFNAWASNCWADDSVVREVRRNHAVIILCPACWSGRLVLLPENEGNPRRNSSTRQCTAICCVSDV
jgi:hypothetical protein